MASSNPHLTAPSNENQISRFREPYQCATAVRINGDWFRNQLLNLRDFFIATWLDWTTFLAVGVVTIGVWNAPHSFTRLFPLTTPDNSIYYATLAYPYVTPIFSPALAGILAAIVPIAVFALTQLFNHSFTDFGSAVMGLAYSMVTATCMQVILKKTIGGLRPHFLAVCQPRIPAEIDSTGQGYLNTMFTAEQLCTGDAKRIRNALESFPSGHATIAFAGFGYLAIYLFTHLRITSLTRTHGSHWKMLCVLAPLLFATYLTSTLVLGYHHHGYDVIMGALIGSTTAVLSYRTVFMGIWDARWNTVTYLWLPQRGSGGSGPASNGNGVHGVNGVGAADGVQRQKGGEEGAMHLSAVGDGASRGGSVGDGARLWDGRNGRLDRGGV